MSDTPDSTSWVDDMISKGKSWIHEHFPDVSKTNSEQPNQPVKLKTPQEIVDGYQK